MRKTSFLSARGREFQRLAHQIDLFRQSEERPSIGDCTPSPQVLLQIIRARRARAECFPAHLFSEPLGICYLIFYTPISWIITCL